MIVTLTKIGFCQYVHFPDSNAVWALDFIGPEIYLVDGDTTINDVDAHTQAFEKMCSDLVK
jgi:hypothetical protein